ncbi:hypothetical protein ACLQ17_25715 [Streptomyces sp. DT197]|uniref:hypothetical protein n=1 Tax=Streptomyces sp. DT197 TaxID=3393417 RepID=UPI003CEB8517
MSVTLRNTFGTLHHVSATNPAHVTGCDTYRISHATTISPQLPAFEDMVDVLQENGLHTRPEGYGVIFLESEEHELTYFGPIEQIEQFKRDNANGPATFDHGQGVMCPRWLQGKGWDDVVPRTTWNNKAHGAVADGVGIVTAFAHTEDPNAEVIVYEYEGAWGPEGTPGQMVTYHCTACHKDTIYDSGHIHENTSPHSRRWTARQARQHILSAAKHGVGGRHSACRPGNGAMLRAVNALARDMYGTSGNPLPDTDDTYCATQGPCSIIREMRAGARPPAYRA